MHAFAPRRISWNLASIALLCAVGGAALVALAAGAQTRPAASRGNLVLVDTSDSEVGDWETDEGVRVTGGNDGLSVGLNGKDVGWAAVRDRAPADEAGRRPGAGAGAGGRGGGG